MLRSDLQNLGMSYEGGREGSLSVPVLHVVHPRHWQTCLRCVSCTAWGSGAVLQLVGQVDAHQLFQELNKALLLEIPSFQPVLPMGAIAQEQYPEDLIKSLL